MNIEKSEPIVERKEVDPIITGYLDTEKFTSKINEQNKDYREEYRKVFEKHLANLEPIEENCRLSIVLPAYREEDLIGETLQSLANQKDVDFNKFEVILVVNYPGDKEPSIPDIFDEKSGSVIEEHNDQTAKIAREFSQNNPQLRLRIIKQNFPVEVAGVGIASKLGMDLAVKRQQFNPGIISYYGAETTFGENFVKGLIDSFADGQTEAVQGRVSKTNYYNKVVETINGRQIKIELSDLEIKEIAKWAKEMWQYTLLLQDIEKIFGVGGTERAGINNLSALTYAKISGMNDLKKGEDWQLARDIRAQQKGEIKENVPGVEIAIWGRVSEPRAGKDSFTDTLWRCYHFLKDEAGDKTKGPLVENPYGYLESVQSRVFDKEAQKLFAISKQNKLIDICPATLIDKDILSKEELVLLLEQPNYESFSEQAVALFKKKFGSDFSEVIEGKLKSGFPPLPLYEAMEAVEEIKEKYGGRSPVS